MLQSYQSQVPENVVVQAARRLGQFLPKTGTLTAVEIGGTDPVPDNTTFDVLKNGVSIFADPDDRPVILLGERTVLVGGLDVAIVRGDKVEVTLAAWPAGGFAGPAFTEISVDDGVAVGLDEAAVTLLATGLIEDLVPDMITETPVGGDLTGDVAHSIVNGIRGRDVGGIPAPPTGTYADDFNDNALDASFWNGMGVALIEAGQHLEVPTYSGGNRSGLYTSALNFTNRTWTVKLTLPAAPVNNNDLYIGLVNATTHNPVPAGHYFLRSGATLYAYRYTSGGDFYGNSIAVPAGTTLWLRMWHDSANAVVRYYYSYDGVNFTTLDSVATVSGQLDFATARFMIAMTLNSANPFYIDNFVTDVPRADTIGNYPWYGILWNNGDVRFALTPVLGVMPLLPAGTVPAGPPPVTLPAGYTYSIIVDDAPQAMYTYSPATGNWSKRLLNS
jgi:hypothetical protein